MIQGYFLSVFFLLLNSLMYYQNKYRIELSFMLRFMDWLEQDRRGLVVYLISGLFITLVLFLLPISPGPIVLGDLIPALVVFYNTLYFFVTIKRKEKNDRNLDWLDKRKGEKKLLLARISLSVGVIHFLLPSFVLL